MSESFVRIVVLAVVVLQAVLSLFCMRRDRSSLRAFFRREEGIPLTVLLASFYFAYCYGIVTYLVEPQWMVWGTLDGIPDWSRWMGLGVFIVGATLIIWGLGTLRTNFAFSVSPQEGSKLVTTGPYLWTRHPLYTAFAFEAIGITLMTRNWFIGLMAAMLWGSLLYRTHIEEEKLIERFGDEYRQYVAKTGRFLPRFRCVNTFQDL